MDFKEIVDSRGKLVAIEQEKTIPFEIKRVFYIYGVNPFENRGAHAHYRTKQVLIALNGRCMVTVENENGRLEILLDHPSKGLLIEPHEWHVMGEFTEGCILLVLASEHYDEKDYIRSYDQYLEVYPRASHKGGSFQ